MVRNKNNGNLQISFRLINEKQTNPRFLIAGQNLVYFIKIESFFLSTIHKSMLDHSLQI